MRIGTDSRGAPCFLHMSPGSVWTLILGIHVSKESLGNDIIFSSSEKKDHYGDGEVMFGKTFYWTVVDPHMCLIKAPKLL